MAISKLTRSEASLLGQRITQDGRSCDPYTTLQQIGRMTVMAVSGGKWVEVRDSEGYAVGVILPCRHARAVEVVLGWNDLYTVRRVRLVTKGVQRGRVIVEQVVRDLYFDQLPEMTYAVAAGSRTT